MKHSLLPKVGELKDLNMTYRLKEGSKIYVESSEFLGAANLLMRRVPLFQRKVIKGCGKACGVSLAGSADVADTVDSVKTAGVAGSANSVDTMSADVYFQHKDFPNSKVEGTYVLKVLEDKIIIQAGDEQGAFYAVQTLFQLADSKIYRPRTVKYVDFDCVIINDAPAFPWRGISLDVARHFMSLNDVLTFIDAMAMHKFNVLHFHITDDQGWRVEIKRYPKLTSVGSFRRDSQLGSDMTVFEGKPHGGFYTQDEVKHIVEYAESQGVQIVPEIDIPGHSQAAIAAYPELGIDYADGIKTNIEPWMHWGVSTEVLNAEDGTIEFYRNVLHEIYEMFRPKYIMLGGDECPRDKWKQSPRIQKRMKELGLNSYDELQGWFIHELSEKTKFPEPVGTIVWNEALSANPNPDTTVIACWENEEAVKEAVKKGYTTINMPQTKLYFDWKQTDSNTEPIPVAGPTTLEMVYNFSPISAKLEKSVKNPKEFVLGSECAIWTEHLHSPRAVYDALYPRACALAEVLWCGDGGSGGKGSGDCSGKRDGDKGGCGNEARGGNVDKSKGRGKNFSEFTKRLTEHLPRLDAIGVNYRRFKQAPKDLRMPGIRGRNS